MRDADWPNLNTLWAEVLVDELARCGLRTVVISPGSRSTPLVMAFSAHPDIEDISIIDERSAAFFALGVARVTRRPTAVVCTSGTAAANYFPAICEANADDVPLLVLTADRPVDRLESGASQAMDQTKLYGDHVRWFHDLGLPELDARRIRALRTTMGLAWRHATSMVAGPVHLNAPFRKPLEPVSVEPGERDAVPDALPDPLAAAVQGRADGGLFSGFDTSRKEPSSHSVERLLSALTRSERPIIVAGADARGASYARELSVLAERLGVPILAEPTSGLRFGESTLENVIAAGDLMLRAGIYDHIGRPDLVLQLGKPPLHWAARELMRQLDSATRIVVTPTGRRLDPEHHSTWFVEADTLCLLELLNARAERVGACACSSEWLDAHRTADRAAVRAVNASMDAEDALHEARIWRELGRVLPESTALFVSNSMPVRHFDTFLQGRGESLVPYYNRGLNGIDGILSTGFGVAHARSVPVRDGPRRSKTVIVTGDVAFRHDVGALLAGRRLDIDATIVVCDNGGGGIFGALPISDFGYVFERHFLTPPNLDADDPVLGVSVANAESWSNFETLLEDSLAEPGLHVIRVSTDRELDASLVETHVEVAAEAVRDALSGRGDVGTRYAFERETSSVPLVALHGFSGSSEDWRRHVEAIGRECILPDLPGHTTSPRLDQLDGRGLDAAVAWLERTLDQAGLARAHLVGYSMGGRIALAFALGHPERVRSLSLIGAHPGIRDPEARADRARWDEDMAAKLERDGLHAFVDEWMGHPLLAHQLELPHSRIVEARQGRLEHTAQGLAAVFRCLGTGNQLPMWDRLAELEPPTLILAGADDSKYVRLGEEFVEHASDATFEVVEGAGHNTLLDAPEQTIRAIRDHIRRVESS
jgi:2-succinyl-5-enolpyruvyl-6-hydroxy-3-cyclohexene-1-carboxylate synthase